MNEKPFLVVESFQSKKEHFEDVLNILTETSDMIKDQDGALMSLTLKPEKEDGAISGISLWTSRQKFVNFMKSDHAEKIMKTGLSEKVKSWTTDINASLYSVEHAWHTESHD